MFPIGSNPVALSSSQTINVEKEIIKFAKDNNWKIVRNILEQNKTFKSDLFLDETYNGYNLLSHLISYYNDHDEDWSLIKLVFEATINKERFVNEKTHSYYGSTVVTSATLYHLTKSCISHSMKTYLFEKLIPYATSETLNNKYERNATILWNLACDREINESLILSVIDKMEDPSLFVDICNFDGISTPLTYLASHLRWKAVGAILNKLPNNKNLDCPISHDKTLNGVNILGVAFINRQLDIIEKILALPNEVSGLENTRLLTIAASGGDVRIAGECPLSIAILKSKNDENCNKYEDFAIRMLERVPFDLARHVIIKACSSNNWNIVRLILKKGEAEEANYLYQVDHRLLSYLIGYQQWDMVREIVGRVPEKAYEKNSDFTLNPLITAANLTNWDLLIEMANYCRADLLIEGELSVLKWAIGKNNLSLIHLIISKVGLTKALASLTQADLKTLARLLPEKIEILIALDYSKFKQSDFDLINCALTATFDKSQSDENIKSLINKLLKLPYAVGSVNPIYLYHLAKQQIDSDEYKKAVDNMTLAVEKDKTFFTDSLFSSIFQQRKEDYTARKRVFDEKEALRLRPTVSAALEIKKTSEISAAKAAHLARQAKLEAEKSAAGKAEIEVKEEDTNTKQSNLNSKKKQLRQAEKTNNLKPAPSAPLAAKSVSSASPALSGVSKSAAAASKPMAKAIGPISSKNANTLNSAASVVSVAMNTSQGPSPLALAAQAKAEKPLTIAASDFVPSGRFTTGPQPSASASVFVPSGRFAAAAQPSALAAAFVPNARFAAMSQSSPAASVVGVVVNNPNFSPLIIGKKVDDTILDSEKNKLRGALGFYIELGDIVKRKYNPGVMFYMMFFSAFKICEMGKGTFKDLEAWRTYLRHSPTAVTLEDLKSFHASLEAQNFKKIVQNICKGERQALKLPMPPNRPPVDSREFAMHAFKIVRELEPWILKGEVNLATLHRPENYELHRVLQAAVLHLGSIVRKIRDECHHWRELRNYAELVEQANKMAHELGDNDILTVDIDVVDLDFAWKFMRLENFERLINLFL